MAYAHDSKSCPERGVGSSPTRGIRSNRVAKAKSGAAKSCGETHVGSSPSPSTIGLLFCFDVV